MRRLEALQGLRGIAFLLIFFGHCGVGSLAGMGVSVFLVLSGFLIIYNHLGKEYSCKGLDNLRFAMKRIKRLYPLHVMMMFPMGFLFLLTALKHHLFGEIINLFIKFIIDILLIQAWIPDRDYYFSINGVAWYLSLSVFLYFVTPYILKVVNKWTKIRTAFRVAILVLFVQLIMSLLVDGFASENVVNWFTYIFPLYRLGDYLIGCCAGFVFRRVGDFSRLSIQKATVFEICSVFAMVICQNCVYVFDIPNGLILSFRYVIGSVLVIFAFGIGKGIVSKVLTFDVLIKLGELSGYTFLIHQVVINLLESIGFKRIILIIVAFIVTVLSSIIYMNIMPKFEQLRGR